METVDTLTTAISTATPRDELRNRVRRTLIRLSETGALPTLPAAASAALAVARDPEADVEKLCRVIQTDAGLAARVLRVANCAASGRRNPARSVQDAIITIGMRKTCDVMVAACAKPLYESASLRAEQLWNHALATAVAAEQLAAVTGIVEVGSAFLPGLFHDVGRVAFLLADDIAADAIADLVEDRDADMPFVEREWYGFDHAEAGAILAEDWGLALELCDAIRWHHDPDQAGAARDLARVVNAADDLADRIGCVSTAEPRPSAALRELGLAAEDETVFAERVQAAWLEQRDFLS